MGVTYEFAHHNVDALILRSSTPAITDTISAQVVGKLSEWYAFNVAIKTCIA